MNSGLRAWVFAAASVTGLLAQNPTNGSLSGRYFARHVQFTTDSGNRVTDARSITGVVTFNGSGGYGFAGQQVILTGVPASYSVSGTYAVAASGVVTMTNPQRAGVNLNARYSAEALAGSSTEVADSTFDFFVAVPAPSSSGLNASALSGTYYAADFELTAASTGQVRNSWFPLVSDGAGNLPAFSVRGHSANSGGNTFQTVGGSTYGVGGDGTGTVTFPLPSGLSSTTALLGPAQRSLYISSSGKVIIAASPGGHDLMIAVKAFSGSATNTSLTASGWYSGIRVDSTGSSAAWAGSMRTTAASIVRSRRLHETGASTPLNDTSVVSFAVASDGSGSAGSAKIGLGLGGTVMTSSNVNTDFDPTGYEIGFAMATPSLTGTGVFVNPLGVVNAASGAPPLDAVSPGEFIAIYGTGLAASTQAAIPPYPASVNGVTVTIGGIAARIQLVSAGQINCLVPYGVTGTSVTVAVNNAGAASNVVTVPLAATAPGIFTLDSTGTNDAAILHLDASLVNAANPAKKGEIVSMYMTGLGAVVNPIGDGQGATAANSARTQIQVLLNGSVLPASAVLYSGLSSLAGLYQINFQIPTTLTFSGKLPIAILTPDAFHDQVNIAVQ